MFTSSNSEINYISYTSTNTSSSLSCVGSSYSYIPKGNLSFVQSFKKEVTKEDLLKFSISELLEAINKKLDTPDKEQQKD